MLSGSSWAEGSYEYHINRPVNYILEADCEKRAFLEKTRFFESGFPAVSYTHLKDLKKPSRLLMPEPEHIAIRI